MMIKIKENKLGIVLAICFGIILAFFGFVIYLSFANEQNGWQTFITLCNGIASSCQQILYGSMKTLELQKNLIIGAMGSLLGLFILVSVFDIYRTRKFVNKFIILRQTGRFIVVRSKELVAFTAGYFNPKIYLSEKLFEKLDVHELNAVLLHEKSHAKTFDNLKNLVLRSLAKTLFFLPILKDIQKIVSERHENTADNEVIHHMSSGRKYLLSSMLKFKSSLQLNESLSYFSARSEKLIDLQEPVYKINTARLLTSIMVIVITALGLVSQNSYAKSLAITQCTEKVDLVSQAQMTKVSSCLSN